MISTQASNSWLNDCVKNLNCIGTVLSWTPAKHSVALNVLISDDLHVFIHLSFIQSFHNLDVSQNNRALESRTLKSCIETVACDFLIQVVLEALATKLVLAFPSVEFLRKKGLMISGLV